MTKLKKCVVCNEDFVQNVGNQKCCNSQCAIEWGKIKTKKSYELSKLNNRALATCIQCNCEFNYNFRPERGERKFCGRSCASKYNIKVGISDAWRLRKNEKQPRIMVHCSFCAKEKFVLKRQFVEHENRHMMHFCDKKCKSTYLGIKFSGEGNPMFGKKLSNESLVKQKETLNKNHPGVKNAFFLAQKRIKTRPQLAIFEFVSNEYPDYEFKIEKLISETKFYADIVSFKHNLIIEFNGSYWHCDPRIYNETYFHAVKKMTASEIWDADNKRTSLLQAQGFIILTVWEKDYNLPDWKITLKNNLKEYGKNKNIDAL